MAVKIGGLIVYDLEEISKKFDVHPNTLRAYIKKGKLRGRKMGNRWFIAEDALRDFFANR